MSRLYKFIIVLSILLLNSILAFSQISVPNGTTSRWVENDICYIFCTAKGSENIGSLTAEAPMNTPSEFVWAKYDTISNSFMPISSNNSSDSLTSTINNLSNGGYKVTISDNSTTSTYFAWVVNNWIEITTPEFAPDSLSTCEGFQLFADYTYADLFVTDTATNEKISFREGDFDFEWEQGGEIVSNFQNPYIEDPIASNTTVEYKITVTDEFECEGEATEGYISKVPDAVASADPTDGEAVLEVTFVNNSINYNLSKWYFYKEDFRLGLEIENADEDEVVDSIDFILEDTAPVYSYEDAGDYQVKLVVTKENDSGNCYDSTYISNISVTEWDIKIPQAFTPNGDGINDNLYIYTRSVKSLNVKIFNRWGSLVYSKKISNIQSSDEVYSEVVWDGSTGLGTAKPGVYYYVVKYVGRDVRRSDSETEGVKLRDRYKTGDDVEGVETGFFHLFRGKH